MAKVVTKKDCFYGGKRYKKGDHLEYSGIQKEKPSYFDYLEKPRQEKASEK